MTKIPLVLPTQGLKIENSKNRNNYFISSMTNNENAEKTEGNDSHRGG